MNRRVLFQMFFLGHFVWLASLFRSNKKPVKVIYKSIPKNQGHSYYQSANDFFHKFYGKSCWAFNKKNMREGKVLSIKSHLLSNKKEVLAEFVYRDRRAFMEYDKMWKNKYPEFKDPVKHIILSIA